MTRQHTIGALVLGCLASAAPALAQHEAGTMSEADLIKSAMSAAPAAVGEAATIITVAPDGATTVIRKGTNNFTCMPDNPNTPGPDPMCGDANAMEWIQAWVEHKTPPSGKVGFMYMLVGGAGASNTDPFADKPTGGDDWIVDGPHVMIVGAKGLMEGYPGGAKPDTNQPYVMWAGTPYEHLMLPVK